MLTAKNRVICLCLSGLALSMPWGVAVAATQSEPILQSEARFQPILARNGIVVSPEALATKVGVDILRKGGNAVDAAVAVGFALAVTYPRAGNLGGGGFMLVHLNKEQRQIAVDYREMAPAAAHRDMYLDGEGNVDKNKVRFSRAAAGVPGTVAGMLYALDNHGTMTRRQVLAPAIRLAQQGFAISYDLHLSLGRAKHVQRDPGANKMFYLKDGVTPRSQGSLLRQRALAGTLKRISAQGVKGFYTGLTARLLAQDMQRNGGLITQQDMAAYKAVARTPIKGTYRGHEVVSMPPPSSGGVHLVQMLNILEGDKLAEYGAGTARSLHLLIESMRRAYADRSEYLGDPDFVEMPLKRITSKEYGKYLRNSIGEKATPSTEINAREYMQSTESENTTHYSIIDRHGNAVANTYTLNFSYGSGIYVPELGIFLNNEMDDFSAKPGIPNIYGLVGGEANAVQPKKRPLSSMTPTIVLRDGIPVLVTGSPGGSFIITTVLQVLINVLDHGMNIAEAVAAPRVHQQWKPDVVFVERGISLDTQKLLQERGHTLRQRSAWGFAGTAAYDGTWFYGAVDPRRRDNLAAGY